MLRTAPSGMVLFFDQKLDRTAAPCPAPILAPAGPQNQPCILPALGRLDPAP